MKREEKIRQVAQKYIATDKHNGVGVRTQAFVDGAEWADKHPASPWHSVADGDLPNKDGRYLTLHTNGIPCIHAFNTQYRRWVINAYQSIVKYWMEIPELPTE